MKGTNLEFEVIRRAINKVDVPKRCKAKLYYCDDYFTVTFSVSKYSDLVFYSEDGKLTYRVFVLDLPKTDFMTVREVKDIDFAFGQLLHFNEEIEG